MKTYFVMQHGSGSVVLQDDRTTFGYGKPADFGYEEASAAHTFQEVKELLAKGIELSR